MSTAHLDNEEADFYRSPFIALCLAVGPAIGFVTLVGYEWLSLSSPLKNAAPLFLLADSTVWIIAYLLGLFIVVPAIVIYVVIGLVFKSAGFLSMLASAVLSPVLVIVFLSLQDGIRTLSERPFTGSLRLLIPSIAAMTVCWLVAGAIRALRAAR